jgi:transcriptional regulator with XRE-family HTH domain
MNVPRKQTIKPKKAPAKDKIEQVIDNTVRRNVRVLLKLQGHNLKWLARKLGKSQANLSPYMKQQGISLTNIAKGISDALGVPVEALFLPELCDPRSARILQILMRAPLAVKEEILRFAEDREVLYHYHLGRQKGEAQHGTEQGREASYLRVTPTERVPKAEDHTGDSEPDRPHGHRRAVQKRPAKK